jgi:hypothetical protein
MVLNTYSGLFCFLFAIIFTAQILGMAGLYTAWSAIPMTIIVAVLAFWGYKRFDNAWLNELESDSEAPPILVNTILFSTLLIVFLVFVQRMILWPHSELGNIISSDFLGYHSIKILDFLRSASVWNLALPYGQYPFGYESLTVFGMLFTGDIRILGTAHALIFVLFWLTIALLLLRYTKMPLAFSLLISLGLCFVPFLYSNLLLIGKNDVLLSLTVLMAILHAPLGSKRFHPLGLAFATMLSLATKVTGLYVLFYLWGLLLFYWWQAYRQKQFVAYLSPFVLILTLAIMFPGGLWVIRNYLVMGEIFTTEVASFFYTSIGANLGNPTLYQSGRESAWLIAGFVFLLIVMGFVWRNPRLQWSMLGVLVMVAATFIVTPLGAFHVTRPELMHVEWRYVLHGIALLEILVLVLLWRFLFALYQQLAQKPLLVNALSVITLIITFVVLGLFGSDKLFVYDSERGERLLDPYGEQQSIYDFARTELDNGVAYVERVNPFYVMYGNPNLTVIEGYIYPLGRAEIYDEPIPDYVMFVPTVRASEPVVSRLSKRYEWELIYEDETGQVYRRVP